MITSKIQIKEHLCEYAKGKFGKELSNPISIPDKYDLYYTIWDLLSPRPATKYLDEGNLEISIPNPREVETRKNPLKFNWLSCTAAKIIEKKIEIMMFAELHDLLDENKHIKGLNFADSTHLFINKYSIESISEDALLKNYYRYRRSIKRTKEIRPYQKI